MGWLVEQLTAVLNPVGDPANHLVRADARVAAQRMGQLAVTQQRVKCFRANEPHRLIASSIGLAVPAEKQAYGYISEHHAYGKSETEAGDYSEDLAASMLASTLGLEFDEDKNWDEKKEIYQVSDKIVRTTNITQSAVVKDGYSTVIAAAVFLF